jgi:hypothetical protein
MVHQHSSVVDKRGYRRSQNGRKTISPVSRLQALSGFGVTGAVLWLNTTVGKLSRVANSKVEFLEMAETNQKRQEWFVEQEAVAYADRGFVPSSSQCIGFAVPAVFAEGGTPDTAFVVDIYEHVSFLGDLHQQLSTSPDGSKVRLRVVSKPSPKS